MTLKQLEAFYWAATAVNFQVAADRLHISLSALSKRIGELETHFGRPLFDRSGHRAALTPAGRQLLPLATRLLKMSHDIDSQLSDGTDTAGDCRFGVGELTALTWLSGFIAQASRQHPRLVLEPSVDLGASLEQRLIDGDIDFAIVAGHSVRAEIVSRPVADVVFVWAASPLLVGEQVTLSADLLQRHPLITMPHGAGPTRMLENWLTAHGLESQRRLTCNNLSAVASLIATGLGIGLFPQGWLDHLSPRGVVVPIRTRSRLPSMPYTFQYRRNDPRPVLNDLYQVVRGTADFTRPSPLW